MSTSIPEGNLKCRGWECLHLSGLGAWARPKWEGRSPKRRTKCLTLTEGRLSFDFGEVTTRLESQAFRHPRGGPMEAALILSSFPIKGKGQEYNRVK